jgi:Cpl-7 lysozyme C-terminal domain.
VGKTNAEVRHDPVRPEVTAKPDYNDLATKVIRGVYCNGTERRQASWWCLMTV